MISFRCFLACFTFLVFGSSSVNAAEVSIRLANPPQKGTIVFSLFDSANTFGDLRDPVIQKIDFLDGRESYRVKNIPPGEYALLVYLDENQNNVLDRNFIGIPREPLAFSNGYRPKGPPTFSRAAFSLAEHDVRRFDLSFYRPLGTRGRFGVGVGAIMQSSPYRDDNGSVAQAIPALTYTGDRLQIYGPYLRFGLSDNDALRIAVAGRYRIGAYEEGDSRFLSGMGDRKDTMLIGLSAVREMPGGIELGFLYQHDVLDRIGGGIAGIGVEKSFQFGVLRFSPEIRMNWLSSEIANHDFGVTVAQATPERPVYQPDATMSYEAGMGLMIEVTPDWLMLVNLGIELLDNNITSSPIVDEDYILKGFSAVVYVF